MKNRLVGYLIAAVLIVGNYCAFYLIASLFNSEIPHFIAAALTSAIVVHELGHLIAMEANKIPAQMVFLIIMGGTSPIKGYEAKFKQLSWERQAFVMLSGAMGNFVVVLVALLVSHFGYITHDEFLRVMNLNGILILWNLFPVWIFDGGRFAKLLFNSIAENRDTRYEISMAAGFVLLLIIILLTCDKFDFIGAGLFFFGLHWQSNHDDPRGSENLDKIPVSHQKWWTVAFMLMIAAGAIMYSATPIWFIP